MEVKVLISKFGLTPHPEGGYYRRVYESKELCHPRYTNETRPASTIIYYLLEKEDFSAFHRLKSDEIWHFYLGDAVEVYMIGKDGQLQIEKLGSDLAIGELPMLVIPASTWFAAKPLGDYALMACTVSPGFDFADFELANRATLLQAYPQYEVLIRRLTRI